MSGGPDGVFSLVVPLYKSEANLPELFTELEGLAGGMPQELEVVFVVDGSPDRCLELVRAALPALPYRAQLIELSRNFGAFAAITAGLAAGSGVHFALLAADLQEPPALILDIARALASGEADVVIGQRTRRADPFTSKLLSRVFWSLYRRFAVQDMPRGGVDTFGCTRQVRDELVALTENDSSLVALLFWLGFRRKFLPYERRKRTAGKSAWTLRKKIDYALFSIFSFTDFPVRLLMMAGALGAAFSLLWGSIVLVARLLGLIRIPGYAAIILTIAFFGGLTTLGLGIVGQYVWISLQNARKRPRYVVRSVEHNRGGRTDAECAP